ncbi:MULTISPECIES: cell envelope integrity protein TolA [Clostridia]|mgnify:FL=1|uniref:Cell envelope integrity protein TolA n=1 Tax=Faecalicatena fissicatena TaxID=290055 RepID=A0ABS2E9Z3_9FIRM|nr:MULTISPECIES: cell envelope integrity protein TolA [Clostridia]MBM6738448.1 cell envelope integrity protein TolA [Faecalicatena fissicatena]
MLEVVLDRHIMVILMGIAAAVGVISKIAAGISLKRLVRAAGSMNKSGHPLVRLVKAKFEHACMVSDRVQNVEVFVEKYLHEYRAGGLRLHTWRRLEKAGVWLCLLFGLAGAGAWYASRGMADQVIQYGAAGAGGAILLFLFQLTSDEKYQLGVIRNYMVDYLENVCAHRYEKAQADRVKEEWKAMAPPDTNSRSEEIQPAREIQPEILQPAEGPQPEIRQPEMSRPEMHQPEMRQSEMGQPQNLREAQEEKAQAAEGREPAWEPVQKAAQEAVRETAAREPAQEQREQRLRFQEEASRELAADAKKRQSGKDRPVRETKAARTRTGKEEDEVSKEVRIREILEEFLA